MPNYCHNSLVIEIDETRLPIDDDWPACEARVRQEKDAFLKILRPDEEGAVQLTNFRPMPEILRNTTTGQGGHGVAFCDWSCKEPLKTIRKLTAEEMRELALYGNRTWYEWASDNWGTKWGDFDTRITHEDGGEIRLEFNSVWCEPNVLLEYIVARHPVTILNQWYEEGGDHGSVYYHCVVESGRGEVGNREVKELANADHE